MIFFLTLLQMSDTIYNFLGIELTNKILEGGIYGQKISNFTKEEIEKLYACNGIEFLTEAQVKDIQNDFMRSNLNKPEDLNSIENIRFNISYWTKLTFGKTRPKNKEIYDIMNFIVQNKMRNVTAKLIKAELNIEPKTISYALKLFKKHNLIKIIDKNIIKYIFNYNSLKINANNNIFNDEIQYILPKKIINYSYEELLKKDIYNTCEGITSIEIKNKYGLDVKQGLKDLIYLNNHNSNLYVSEYLLRYKSTVLAFFTKENHEKFNLIKKHRLQKGNGLAEIQTITRNDKEYLIREELKKNKGIFVLNAENVEKLSAIAGVNYTFDKKNLLKIIKNMNVNILELNQTTNKRIVYTNDYTEEEVKNMFLNKEKVAKYLTILKYNIFSNKEIHAIDNLWQKDECERNKIFLTILNTSENFIQFTTLNILEMLLKDYLAIIKVSNIYFLEYLALDLYKNKFQLFNKIRLSEDLNTDVDIYIQNFNNTIFNKDQTISKFIKALINQIIYFPIKVVIDLDLVKQNKSFQYGLTPTVFKKYFIFLQNKQIIDFKCDTTLWYKKHSNSMNEFFSIRSTVISYDDRLFIWNKFKNQTTVESILSTIDTVTQNLDSYFPNNCENRANFFLKGFKNFKNIINLNKPIIAKNDKKSISLSRNVKEMIIVIKWLLSKHNLTIQEINNLYKGDNFQEVLQKAIKYLNKKRILFNIKGTINQFKPSKLFVKYYNVDTSNIGEYYAILHNKIHKFIVDNGSCDLNGIMEKFTIYEPFEIEEYFIQYSNEYEIDEFMGLKIIFSKL